MTSGLTRTNRYGSGVPGEGRVVSDTMSLLFDDRPGFAGCLDTRLARFDVRAAVDDCVRLGEVLPCHEAGPNVQRAIAADVTRQEGHHDAFTVGSSMPLP